MTGLPAWTSGVDPMVPNALHHTLELTSPPRLLRISNRWLSQDANIKLTELKGSSGNRLAVASDSRGDIDPERLATL
jgi:hypothetical protein